MRVACPSDRRVTFAQITPKGKKLIEQVFPSHRNEIDRMISVLSEEEKEIGIELLKKLGLSVKKY